VVDHYGRAQWVEHYGIVGWDSGMGELVEHLVWQVMAGSCCL